MSTLTGVGSIGPAAKRETAVGALAAGRAAAAAAKIVEKRILSEGGYMTARLLLCCYNHGMGWGWLDVLDLNNDQKPGFILLSKREGHSLILSKNRIPYNKQLEYCDPDGDTSWSDHLIFVMNTSCQGWCCLFLIKINATVKPFPGIVMSTGRAMWGNVGRSTLLLLTTIILRSIFVVMILCTNTETSILLQYALLPRNS